LEVAKTKKKWPFCEPREDSKRSNHYLKKALILVRGNFQRLGLTRKAERKLTCAFPKENEESKARAS
jgi:hypothetical protein